MHAVHEGHDQDFVVRVLKVSLNTYKKCITPCDASLRLKRHTLTILFQNAGRDPARDDLPIALPRTPGPQAGYTRQGQSLPHAQPQGQPRRPPLLKLRGVQLTHAFPKGFFQPFVTLLYPEDICDRVPAPSRGTLQPNDPDHRNATNELRRIEEDSEVFTPLLACRLDGLHQVVPFRSPRDAAPDNRLRIPTIPAVYSDLKPAIIPR
ncbi:MAG: hypothetical protein NTZ14_12985 [Hyphomicrobiales bacterium]|nr:hypothetical protein [Hyphomicrobiales bacterium]